VRGLGCRGPVARRGAGKQALLRACLKWQWPAAGEVKGRKEVEGSGSVGGGARKGLKENARRAYCISISIKDAVQRARCAC
jgi:hypothetical protein